MTKNSVALSISGTIHHMIVIYGAKAWNDNISRCFFQFSNFDFPGCQGAERAKNAQNDENLSVARYISGTIHHMIFIYGTHICMCKRIISPGIFFFVFQNLIFGIIRKWVGVKRAKHDPNDKKILPVSLHISGTVHHMIVIFGAHV